MFLVYHYYRAGVHARDIWGSIGMQGVVVLFDEAMGLGVSGFKYARIFNPSFSYPKPQNLSRWVS